MQYILSNDLTKCSNPQKSSGAISKKIAAAIYGLLWAEATQLNIPTAIILCVKVHPA